MVSFQLLLECFATMCAVLVARQSAIRHRRPLVYIQAIDEPRSIDPHANTGDRFKQLLAVPSLSQIKKLPGVVVFNQGMRMRLINYDVAATLCSTRCECTVVGFEPDPADHNINSKIRVSSCTEMK